MINKFRFWVKRFYIRLLQINSPNRFRVFCCDALIIINNKLFGRPSFLQRAAERGLEKSALYAERKMASFFDGEKYNFNGIYLPYKKENSLQMWDVVQDVLSVYLYNGDDYDSRYVNRLDRRLPEGVYCYSDAGAKIVVSKGDVVLDVGAWIGDFSAYCCKKGATVYAFEPAVENIAELNKTVAYNIDSSGAGVIHVEPYGVGEKTETRILVRVSNSAGIKYADGQKEDGEKLQVVALDDWIKTKDIKVDFIKADIEGYERRMLRGARNLLREHCPALSLCTYHLPDDPHVLSEIILDANPNYRIIQRKMKLFAYVPKRPARCRLL